MTNEKSRVQLCRVRLPIIATVHSYYSGQEKGVQKVLCLTV